MCQHCNWDEWFEAINEMKDLGEFEWAFDTLDGIAEWVENNEHITDKQKEAVENIHARREDCGVDLPEE